MDPAAYARYHGVQSESNKVTVTRVACGEILYRRAVDTYRRDVRFKVNSIKKEQKRLRGCMRGYRHKLRETKERHSQEKAAHRQSTEKLSTELTAKSEERTEHSPTQDGHMPHFWTKKHRPSLSAAPAHKQLPSTPPTLEIHNSELVADFNHSDNDSRPHITADMENVGRTVRIGSGKIGASSSRGNIMDDEDDAISILSDSSNEEQSNDPDPVDVVIFKHGRFVKCAEPFSLIKTKAAYFKSIDHEVKNVEGDNEKEDELCDHDCNENTEEQDHINVGPQDTDSLVQETDPSFQPNPARSLNEVDSRLLRIGLTPQIVLPNTDQSQPDEVKVNGGDDVFLPPQTIRQREPRFPVRKKKVRTRRKPGVSFGDLIKLQHNNNPKKLFSLVDRMAEKIGEIAKPSHENATPHHNDPRISFALKRRAAQAKASEDISSSLTTYGSIFYAMKFGYSSTESDDASSQTASQPNGRACDSLRTLKTTRSFPEQPPYNMKSSQTDGSSPIMPKINDEAENIPGVHLGLPPPLVVGGRKISKSDPGSRSPFGAGDFGENKHVDGVIEMVAASNDPSTMDIRHQRELRRSSILEASRYVSKMKAPTPTNVSEEDLISKHERIKRDQKRRASTHPEGVQSFHQVVAEEHKESWSSAFSRIKLVHTLVDLTHMM